MLRCECGDCVFCHSITSKERRQMHDTYLNGARHGWPQDHTAEDTFDMPPVPPAPVGTQAYYDALKTSKIAGPFTKDTPQYSAGYTGSGQVVLVLSTPDRTIGYFDTLADAQLAAEALNNLKGY